ncbi:MAG TPA: hypothetical protein VJM50_17460 [Pyrinomonadaceae bacterium]|nr:hypothetical protein [Pyrinomonadaceae bacterium]
MKPNTKRTAGTDSSHDEERSERVLNQDQDPHHEPEPENPWPIEDYPQPPAHCECPPSPSTPSTPCDSPIVKPKGDDCCRQLIEILRGIPGIDERAFKFRKPKTDTKIKLANLCCALPVKERLGPILLLILRRYRDGVTPGNSFESKMQGVLGQLSAKHRKALERALDAYDRTPAGARDCAFETRFDDWPNDKPLDPGFIARNVVGEMLAIGRMVRFGPHPQPIPSIGSARPWEQSFELAGEPGKYAKLTGPWPWICAIGPAANKATDLVSDWYRNESACTPGNIPRGTLKYSSHEFAWECTTTPNPQGGQGVIECKHQPPIGPSGGFGFGECPGGWDYRVFQTSVVKDVCLEIPDVDPGTEVGLRGLNFFSPNAKVKVRKLDHPPFPDIPLIPLSDWKPDTTTPPGTATCEVRDFAFFNMPDHIKDPVNPLNDLPIPPGRYAVKLVVPNDVNFAVTGGGAPPKEFLSNEVLFDLQPPPKQRYQILTDEARCYEETDGPGSDEPWFRAMSAVAELPKSATKIAFPLLNRVEIMTTDDVDTGEWISFPGATLFSDVLGKRVFAAGVIGLEVDSESAARAEIDDFWDAYGEYLSNFFVQLGASTDAGMLGAALKAAITAGSMSVWVWVTGGILIAIFAAGFLYAAWAPADQIAIDSLTFTSRQLAELTDTNPAHIRGADRLEVRELRMNSESLGKKNDNDFQATYSERRHYRSTVEESHYGFVYRFKRI